MLQDRTVPQFPVEVDEHQQQQQVLDETKRLDHVLAPPAFSSNIDSFCGCFCDRHRRRCLPHTNVPFRFDRLLGSFNCFADANIRTHVISTDCLIPQPPLPFWIGKSPRSDGVLDACDDSCPIFPASGVSLRARVGLNLVLILWWEETLRASCVRATKPCALVLVA